MKFTQKEAMTRALAMVGTPRERKGRERGDVHTQYSAAKACGVSVRGLWSAMERQRRQKAQPEQKGD